MTGDNLSRGGIAATLVGRGREVAFVDAFLSRAVSGGAASGAQGRADFEDAYRHATAISPAGTLKLGITSRAALRDALAAQAGSGSAG